MPFLRQSTAQTIRFGPCLDKTDGVTEETALTLAQADMRLSKDGGAFAQKSAAGNATHDSDGWYSTSLSTTDTNTVGELILNVHQPANMLPVWLRWWVLEEAVYDAMFGASAAGPLQSTTAGRTLDVTATGEAGIDLDNTSGTLAAAQIATDAITADKIAANAITSSEIADNAITAAKIATDAITAAKIAADAIGSSEFAQAAADKVWDTATRVLTANTNLNDISTADVDARLAAIGLDHLLSAAVVGADVTDNSIIARLVSASATADWDDFVNTTDSLQALRDRGDAAWATATGFSTHSAADVWAVGTRTLTASTNFNDISAADVNAEVLDVLNVDTFSLPGQTAPPLAPTLVQAITWLYKVMRNRKTQTASQWSLLADNETTVDAKAAVSDDGTTAIKQEIVSGP